MSMPKEIWAWTFTKDDEGGWSTEPQTLVWNGSQSVKYILDNAAERKRLADELGPAISPAKNTDRELWREREGDYYADSIHVTENGGIGINCGGTVFVKTLREWHKLAGDPPRLSVAEEAARLLAISANGRFGEYVRESIEFLSRLAEMK